MKRLLTGLLLLSFALGAWAQTAPTSVIFSWTGNGNPGMPTCSASVTKGCLTGFTLTDVTNAASPIVISSSIAPAALSYTLTPLPSAGVHNYTLVINAVNSSGAAVASTPDTASVTIPSEFSLNPPTGFAVAP